MLSAESILKAMPEFAYVFNKHNELVLWNKNLESLLGYSPDELYRKNVYDFMEKSVKDINTEVISKLFRDKEEQSLEQNTLAKLLSLTIVAFV